MIKDYFEVTEEGELLLPDWVDKALEAGDFTTIKTVIGAQWVCGDQLIEKKYPYPTEIKLLTDKTGVLACEKPSADKRPNEIVLYDPDGSERFRISVPSVSEYSKLGKGYFYGADFEEDGSCTVYLNDGTVDYKAKLNVKTGELSGFEQTRV